MLPSGINNEAQRSRAQRGGVGHYVAGAYRVLLRPLLTAYHIAHARLIAFLWGMEDVSLYVSRLPRRYLMPVLRAFGAQIGANVALHSGLYLHNGTHNLYRGLSIGDNSTVSPNVFIDLAETVHIGANVTLSSGVRIVTHIDVGNSPLAHMGYPPRLRPVVIGDGVYIGMNATITDGVTVGENALIAAHALVLDNVAGGVLVAGVPATEKKRIGTA